MVRAPWNNPLVATAFQIRNRRGGLFMSTSIYVVLLAMGSMAWLYYVSVYVPSQPGLHIPFNPLVGYFIALFVIQLALSSMMAVSRTSASIKAEVVNKTLDFQRIAALSPWDIMIGKLFGEASLAFLLIIASFPFAFFCWLLGMPGLSLTTLALLYLSLFSTSLMFGSFGLQNTLVIPAGKATGGGVPGFGILVGLTIAASLNMAWIGAAAPGGAWHAKPWSVALIGLLTPLPSLYGIALGDPWQVGLSWFQWKIPFLVVTPLAQLLIAYLCMFSMARRLENLAQPVLDKRSCYAFLLIMDLISIGVLDACKPMGLALGPRLALFCILHLFFTMVIVIAATPTREMLSTWVWRYRGRQSYFLAEWLGDRSLNTMMLLTSCFILLAMAWGMIAMAKDPADWLQEIHLSVERTFERSAEQIIPRALGVTCALLLAGGALYQCFLVVAGKYGTGVFFLVVLMSLAMPTSLGIYLHAQLPEAARVELPENLGLTLSPLIHFLAWMGLPLAVPGPWPLIGVSALAGGWALWITYRAMLAMAAKVDHILIHEMNVEVGSGKTVQPTTA